MVSSLIIGVAKIVVMIILLCAMILVLLGIGQFVNDQDNSSEDVKKYKSELSEKENVIGRKSVFNNFLVRNVEVHHHDRKFSSKRETLKK